MSYEFSVTEIVWAKIRGYPWWPAFVKSIHPDPKENKFKVYFIGDNTHATLPHSKITNFQKSYKDHSKTKKSKLLDSIKKAKEMVELQHQKESKDSSINKKKEIDLESNNETTSKFKEKNQLRKVTAKDLANPIYSFNKPSISNLNIKKCNLVNYLT